MTLTIFVGVFAGGLMAATVAALTGLAAVRLAGAPYRDPNKLNGARR